VRKGISKRVQSGCVGKSALEGTLHRGREERVDEKRAGRN